MLVWGWGRYFLWHIAGGDRSIGDYFQIGCENCNDYQNCSEFRRCRCACDHPIFRHNTVITVITIRPSPGIRTQISGSSEMHKMCSFWCKFLYFLRVHCLRCWFDLFKAVLLNSKWFQTNKWQNIKKCCHVASFPAMQKLYLRCKNVLKSNFDFPLCYFMFMAVLALQFRCQRVLRCVV